MDTPERLFRAWPGSPSCVTEVLLREKTWSYLYNLGLLGGIVSAPRGAWLWGMLLALTRWRPRWTRATSTAEVLTWYLKRQS